MANTIVMKEDALWGTVSQLKNVCNGMQSASRALGRVNLDTDAANLRINISYQLRMLHRMTSASNAGSYISKTQSDMIRLSASIDSLSGQLSKVINRYAYAEQTLAGKSGFAKAAKQVENVYREQIINLQAKIQQILQQMEEKRAQDIEEANTMQTFDPENIGNKKFGGDQEGPLNDYTSRKDEYLNIIERNTGRRLSDKELKTYMTRLNSEGCGYVALINAIFCAYEGRAEDFERDFGFPMYYKGNLNYNHLLVDLYSCTDNINNGEFDKYRDYDGFWEDGFKFAYSYWNDDSGNGTSPADRVDHIDRYLEEHNVNVETYVYEQHLTATQYNRMIENGEVTQGEVHIRIGGTHWHLRDSNGNIVSTYSGGHAMTVTGTRGNLIEVSSWGERYYIDPSDIPGDGYYEYMIVDIGSRSDS